MWMFFKDRSSSSSTSILDNSSIADMTVVQAVILGSIAAFKSENEFKSEVNIGCEAAGSSID
jgi:hypothetical protein